MLKTDTNFRTVKISPSCVVLKLCAHKIEIVEQHFVVGLSIEVENNHFMSRILWTNKFYVSNWECLINITNTTGDVIPTRSVPSPQCKKHDKFYLFNFIFIDWFHNKVIGSNTNVWWPTSASSINQIHMFRKEL